MAMPPRPPRAGTVEELEASEQGGQEVPTLPATPEIPVDVDRQALAAELDEATRKRVADVIARAIASELGAVRVSSIPPPSGAPRSSIRAAAASGGKLGKWSTMGVGALALIGQMIVWFGKPEYAGPIAQALRLIASVIGGGPPELPP